MRKWVWVLLLLHLLYFDMRREFAGAGFDKPTDEVRNTFFVDPCCCFSLGNSPETECQQPFRIAYSSHKSAELGMRGYASTWLWIRTRIKRTTWCRTTNLRTGNRGRSSTRGWWDKPQLLLCISSVLYSAMQPSKWQYPPQISRIFIMRLYEHKFSLSFP